MHIDGGFARKKHATSAGNMPYDISIASNTKIRVLRKPAAVEKQSISQQFTIVSIENSCKVEGMIRK